MLKNLVSKFRSVMKPHNLQWHQIVKSTDSGYLVSGTELASAYVPNTLSRFKIYEIRGRWKDGYADTTYVVRDAETITMDDIKNGNRPHIVFRNPDLEKCLGFVKKVLDEDEQRFYNLTTSNETNPQSENTE